MVRRRAAKTIDELLAQARPTLPDRPSPAEALHAQASGALLIDIRSDDQRRENGLIPGAIVLPRNCLEWRCDPASQWRHPAITRRDLRIILICNQGYQSSLAAATLSQVQERAGPAVAGCHPWCALAPPRGALLRRARQYLRGQHSQGPLPAATVWRPARLDHAGTLDGACSYYGGSPVSGAGSGTACSCRSC